jgi:hypothetical protein
MPDIPPEKMERYRAHLAGFQIDAAKRDEAIRSLHLIFTVLIDLAWNESDAQLVEKSRISKTFLAISRGDSIVSDDNSKAKHRDYRSTKSNSQSTGKTRHDLE